MQTFVKDIVIDRPRSAVYAQLERFEEYPEFLAAAQHVERLDARRMRWTVNLGPLTKEYEAEITEQRPDELIAWRAAGDEVKEAGEIRLETAPEDRTTVRLSIAYATDSVVLQAADAVGLVERRITNDLERMKEYIEDR